MSLKLFTLALFMTAVFASSKIRFQDTKTVLAEVNIIIQIHIFFNQNRPDIFLNRTQNMRKNYQIIRKTYKIPYKTTMTDQKAINIYPSHICLYILIFLIIIDGKRQFRSHYVIRRINECCR